MRRLTLHCLLAGFCLLLSACALQPPAPKTFTVSEQQLAKAIASQFPFDSTMLEVLDVVVSTPRITLDPVANRINTSLDLSVAANSVLGLLVDKTYKGGVDMGAGGDEAPDREAGAEPGAACAQGLPGLSPAAGRPAGG